MAYRGLQTTTPGGSLQLDSDYGVYFINEQHNVKMISDGVDGTLVYLDGVQQTFDILGNDPITHLGEQIGSYKPTFTGGPNGGYYPMSMSPLLAVKPRQSSLGSFGWSPWHNGISWMGFLQEGTVENPEPNLKGMFILNRWAEPNTDWNLNPWYDLSTGWETEFDYAILLPCTGLGESSVTPAYGVVTRNADNEVTFDSRWASEDNKIMVRVVDSITITAAQWELAYDNISVEDNLPQTYWIPNESGVEPVFDSTWYVINSTGFTLVTFEANFDWDGDGIDEANYYWAHYPVLFWEGSVGLGSNTSKAGLHMLLDVRYFISYSFSREYNFFDSKILVFSDVQYNPYS